MRITKVGHSCLIIEEGELKLLLDPGNYSPVPDVSGLDVVLITHEHDDHCYLPAIQEVLDKNPRAEIITHEAVGKKLAGAGIAWTLIKDGETLERKGVAIASYGTEHARINPDLPAYANTGFLVAGRFFYPGDSFHVPPVPVKILALPAIGSWMKLEEAIEYAKTLAPKTVFPVHDGILKPEARNPKALLRVLAPLGIGFTDMAEGSVLEA